MPRRDSPFREAGATAYPLQQLDDVPGLGPLCFFFGRSKSTERSGECVTKLILDCYVLHIILIIINY